MGSEPHTAGDRRSACETYIGDRPPGHPRSTDYRVVNDEEKERRVVDETPVGTCEVCGGTVLRELVATGTLEQAVAFNGDVVSREPVEERHRCEDCGEEGL